MPILDLKTVDGWSKIMVHQPIKKTIRYLYLYQIIPSLKSSVQSFGNIDGHFSSNILQDSVLEAQK
jgi:hypothetical protein